MNHPCAFIDHSAFWSTESSARISSRFIAACRSLALGGAVLLMVQAMSAAPISFSSASDYDNNFYEVFNGNLLTWTSAGGGYLQKTQFVSSASVAVYNTAATGGTSGSGGAAGGAPLNKFNNFTIQADFSTPSLVASNSLGFYTKVNDAGTAGYAAIFNITSSTTATFRLFESTGDLTIAGVGSQIGSTVNLTTTGSFALNTFYTFKLTVTDVGSDVRFDASMWTTGGSQIGIVQSFTDTSSAVTGFGQVGVRLASDVRMDNFSVTPASIPEPGTSAIFASGAALLLAGMIRRKRANR